MGFFHDRARASIAVTCLTAVCLAAPSAAVVVRDPGFGLPHFYGSTDLEFARENGREIAKDRLAQIILLARVGRGTLSQVFAILDPSTLDDDIVTRQTAYTSSELNGMFEKLPERERMLLLEYCKGVNDTIEAIYKGELSEPLEINALRVLGFTNDLFGNAQNISDQVDPFYKAPGGADPEHPMAGFQYTPEMAVAIGVLEVRNFGVNGFDEPTRLTELQALIAKHGDIAGTQIWDDFNFLNDPLAPVTVPDPTTPGYGGPLAAKAGVRHVALAQKQRFPRYDYAAAVNRHKEAAKHREQFATWLGAWPKMGSYAWVIGGGKSASGYPWVGGFPQTGIQTPSIMHFSENRTAEGIQGVGMEFAGAPLILIGHTDSVAWTTTTAQLRTIETFFEQVVNESTDTLHYSDEGTPAALSPRTEIFKGNPDVTRVFWRSRERNGNGGTRAILDFMGDVSGTADSATANTLVDDRAFSAALQDGFIAIISGTGTGQMRKIATVPDMNTVETTEPWATTPDDTSEYIAVQPGNNIIAVALDSPLWLEETTTVLGFSRFQRATDIQGIKEGSRLMPSTHNFIAADNRPFNQIGTASGNGNIGYWTSGFSRLRIGGNDPRLPTDGTVPNPFVEAEGVVASATNTTLVANTPVFDGRNFAPPPVNFRYQNPTELGREYIVSIMSGTGYKQTRRIASNSGDTLTLEYPWGVNPAAGDLFEVYAIVANPEAVNPMEAYMANWNNKSATADEGDNFGRQFRHVFILERLAAENAWDRDKQRQLNKDLAGLDGKGKFGRFLIPRLRQALDAEGATVDPSVEAVLDQLEAHNGQPSFGRFFIDPVNDTQVDGEVNFLNNLINALASAIYADELEPAVGTPGDFKGLNLVQHAIDSAAGDLAGAYTQKYAGDYFNGVPWETVVRETFADLAGTGIPAPSDRPLSTYRHPLAGLESLEEDLTFEPTLRGNRGTYEQIVEVGPTVKGEFIFPLGQSGLIEGSLEGVTSVDRNFTTLQPIWRDWRFVPMLAVSADLATGGNGDSDQDGVLDAYERWYYGDLTRSGTGDGDGDGLNLAGEYRSGGDPTDRDTDDDGIPDGIDVSQQDRLASPQCAGDCSADNMVTVDELVRIVNIILETTPLSACNVVDFNHDGQATIEELVKAVNVTLGDCIPPA